MQKAAPLLPSESNLEEEPVAVDTTHYTHHKAFLAKQNGEVMTNKSG